LHAQQRPPWRQAILEPSHVEQIHQADFVHGAASPAVQELVHRSALEEHHGAGWLAQLGGVDHQHGMRRFDVRQKIETDRAAVDAFALGGSA
jgi:hypothetical protein